MDYQIRVQINLRKILVYSIILLMLTSIFFMVPTNAANSNLNYNISKPLNSVYYINWTSGNTYYIESDLTINSSTTLNIASDVTVLINGSYYINIEGQINAVGSQNKPINFTSNSTFKIPGDWGGIRFKQTGDGSIQNCSINYSTTAISVESQNVILIKNCQISWVSDNGIFINNSTVNLYNNFINDITNNGIMVKQSDQLRIIGNVLSISSTGINVTKSNNITIENNRIYFANNGIHISDVNNTEFNIRENKIFLFSTNGIHIKDVEDIIIYDCEISNNFKNGNGILFDSCRNILVDNCYIYKNNYGSELLNSVLLTLENSNITENYNGIYLDNSIGENLFLDLKLENNTNGIYGYKKQHA